MKKLIISGLMSCFGLTLLAQELTDEPKKRLPIWYDIQAKVGIYQTDINFDQGYYSSDNRDVIFGYHLTTSIHPFEEKRHIGFRTGLSYYHTDNIGQFNMYSIPIHLSYRSLLTKGAKEYRGLFEMLYSFLGAVVLAPLAPFILPQYPGIEVYFGPTFGYYNNWLNVEEIPNTEKLFYQIEYGLSIEAKYKRFALSFDFIRHARSLFGLRQEHVPRHFGLAAGMTIFI